MNISGTLNVFRLLRDPTLCLPQHTVSTFNHLPIPLSKAFPKKATNDGDKEVDIRAVVLDKDNCFAIPHTDEIHQPYKVGFLNSRVMASGAKFPRYGFGIGYYFLSFAPTSVSLMTNGRPIPSESHSIGLGAISPFRILISPLTGSLPAATPSVPRFKASDRV